MHATEITPVRVRITVLVLSPLQVRSVGVNGLVEVQGVQEQVEVGKRVRAVFWEAKS